MQNLGGVDDPASVYLVVGNIFKDWNEIRAQEDVVRRETPQEDHYKLIHHPFYLGSDRMQLPSHNAEVVQGSHYYNRPLQYSVDLSSNLDQQTYVILGQQVAEGNNEPNIADVQDGEN